MTTVSRARKTVLAFAAAAIVTTAVPAGATDYGAEVPPVHHGKSYKTSDAAIAGALFGLAVGVIATKSRRHCFDKPIRKWNRWEGRKVIVGYKTVCR